MSTQQYVEAGDVKIFEITLQSKDKQTQLNLMPQFLSFSIYEDLQCPVVYAEVQIQDAINLVQDFPIIGEEFIKISFITPGLLTPANYTFAVLGIEGGHTTPTSKMAEYTLRCSSIEQLASAAQMIQVSKQAPYSDLVEDIVKRYIGTTKSLLLEPTKGVPQAVVPKLKPFAAIDYIRKQAMSITNISSGFVFFENQHGFFFCTVEKLIDLGRKANPIKTFRYSGDVMSSKEARANTQRNIIKYETLSRSDSVDKIQTGMMNNAVSGFDMLTKGIRETVHNISTDISKFVTTDKKSRSQMTQTFFQDYGQKPADTFFIPYDSSRVTNDRDTTFAARRAYTNMLNQNTTRILIHGDSSMVAGELITINVPAVTATTERQKPDQLVSGNYLVVRMRHIIANDPRNKHMIAADVIKVGYSV